MDLFLLESQGITGPFSASILNRRYSNGEIFGEILAKPLDALEWRPLYTLLKHIKPSKEFLLREELAAREKARIANILRLKKIRDENIRQSKERREEFRRTKKMEIPSGNAFREERGTKAEPNNQDFASHKTSKTEVEYACVLGLQGKTTRADIKKAYRRRIAEYHPDKVAHLGVELRELAEEKSKEINEAFAYFQGKYDLSSDDPI